MGRTTVEDVRELASGFHEDPMRSMSLRAAAYTEQRWPTRTWRPSSPGPGSWSATSRSSPRRAPTWRRRSPTCRSPSSGTGHGLRAFYNVCKHRAHELLAGSGTTHNIVCPYHAWTFDLDGKLKAARRAERMPTFDRGEICLDQVAVEEFGGFVYVNLDPQAAPLAEQAGDLAAEIARWAPDVAELTHAKRLTYHVATNWKNVIDNFLECYHCHIAHKEFVSLVDLRTYAVRTHGIWSSHFRGG